jgi:hypothetical protein
MAYNIFLFGDIAYVINGTSDLMLWPWSLSTFQNFHIDKACQNDSLTLGGFVFLKHILFLFSAGKCIVNHNKWTFLSDTIL